MEDHPAGGGQFTLPQVCRSWKRGMYGADDAALRQMCAERYLRDREETMKTAESAKKQQVTLFFPAM